MAASIDFQACGPYGNVANTNTETAENKRRLNTFTGWGGAKTKEELAQAGFIYMGSDDKVRCERCNLVLSNWSSAENPWNEHVQRRPNCPFVTSRSGQSPPPKHPEYKDLQARLQSFVGWPARFVPKTPNELATAGFFYIGSADRVTCFQCGVTLRDWGSRNNPVEEHRKYSENCTFINKVELEELGVNTRPPTKRSTEPQNESHTTQAAAGSVEHKEPLQIHTGGCENIDIKATCEKERISDSIPDREELSEAKPTSDAGIKHSEDNQKKQRDTVKTESANSTSSSEDEGESYSREVVAQENKHLRDNRTCRLCRSESSSILFLPCGHLVTCSSCAPKVNNCLRCGKAVLGTVRTYFS